MVTSFYNLNEQPFGVTPDPRYLFLSASHREALASIQYGVTAGRGFTALIAHPGMGKTTLLFEFLSKLPSSCRSVFLFQSQSTPGELLQSLLADLEILDDSKDITGMQRQLNRYLIRESRQGRRLIIVIDEAQNLDDGVLEAVRMLSNFETPREKLLHVVLAGQPALADRLQAPSLVQLRQRISIVASLRAFSPKETREYIKHRLKVAGYDRPKPLFTEQALALIARHAEGIPRNINNICFNAMSLGCATKENIIDVVAVQEVLDDLDLSGLFSKSAGGFRFEPPTAFFPDRASEEENKEDVVDGMLVQKVVNDLELGALSSESMDVRPFAAPIALVSDVALKDGSSVTFKMSAAAISLVAIVAYLTATFFGTQEPKGRREERSSSVVVQNQEDKSALAMAPSSGQSERDRNKPSDPLPSHLRIREPIGNGRRLSRGVSESFLGNFGKCDPPQIDYVQDVDTKMVGRDEKMLIPGCEGFNWSKY
jgi:type II secretory pathway predicted ATPase ExeA